MEERRQNQLNTEHRLTQSEERDKSLIEKVDKMDEKLDLVQKGFEQHYKDDNGHFTFLKVGLVMLTILQTLKGNVDINNILGILKAFASY